MDCARVPLDWVVWSLLAVGFLHISRTAMVRSRLNRHAADTAEG